MESNIKPLIDHLKDTGLNHTVLADGSGVILDTNASQVLTLNATGVLLTDLLLAGISSTKELSKALQDKYGIDEATATQDTASFIQQLSSYLGIT